MSQIIDSWNFQLPEFSSQFTFVQRLKKYVPSQLAQSIFQEYKRFLKLAIKYQAVAPSNLVDEAWHLHLVDNKNYYQLCEKLNQDIMHSPTANNNDKKQCRQIYQKTLEYYRKQFNEKPNKMIWNQAKNGACSGLCSHNCQFRCKGGCQIYPPDEEKK